MENSSKLGRDLQHKIDTKTKPLGALGVLERLAFQIGTIQQTLSPTLQNPHILLFAGDHGITQEGVSPYPQEVTAQMVLNFVRGGAAINVFAKQHNIALQVIDVGVNYDFPPDLPIVHAKVGKGTHNFLRKSAMTIGEAAEAMRIGKQVVQQAKNSGCNIIGFGEMGIGNTSSASILMHLFTGIPLEECVGKGTGLDDVGLARKKETLQQALQNYTLPTSIEKIDTVMEKLCHFGGFEIVAMVQAIWEARDAGMTILIDGFIVTSALLVAHTLLGKRILENCIFTHTSGEQGHAKMLDFLGAKPILNLGMRLGEGTGCALAYPIVQSAINFLNEMASFEEAQVSEKL
jgi:nicotinate-nucleotide--dimethylbenzimidazole phosphoribosyltransferase